MLHKNKIRQQVKKVLASGLLLGLLAATNAIADDIEVYIEEPPLPLPPNILFLLDESGSMVWNAESTSTHPLSNSDTRQRAYRMKTAMKNMLDNEDLQNVMAAIAVYSRNYSDPIRLKAYSDFRYVATERAALKSAVDNIGHSGGTPTAKALRSAVTWINTGLTDSASNTLSSPIPTNTPKNNWCRTNHIVLLTDGAPNTANSSFTNYNNLKVNSAGNLESSSSSCRNDAGGGRCAKEVAYWGDHANLRTGNEWDNAEQNITTYTIGFGPVNSTITNFMQAIANAGGEGNKDSGDQRYFRASNVDELTAVFETIVEKATTKIEYTYTAPSIPFNPNDAAVTGGFIYVPVFKPAVSEFWNGNLKKYKFSTNDAGIHVTDAADDSVLDVNSRFIDSIDLWGSSPDGGDVLVGGAASHMSGTRNLYSNIDSSDDALTAAANRVIKTNNSLSTDLVLAAIDIADREDAYSDFLLDWINWGATATYATVELETLAGRMGAPIHSKPVVVNYGTGDLVFLAGSDGILKAIDTSTGSEVWSFIPKDLIPGILTIARNVEFNSTQVADVDSITGPSTDIIPYYGLDGPMTYYEIGSQKYLVFGMRRGGYAYYALNITNRLAPKFAWKIDKNTANFAKLGQTWSKPLFVKMNLLGTETVKGSEDDAQDVLVFGGGYDTNQDYQTDINGDIIKDVVTGLPLIPTSRTNDARGNAIFIVNPATGAKLKTISRTGANVNIWNMKNAIAGDLLTVDINANGVIDRLYAAGVGGRIIRVDIPDAKLTGDVTSTISGGIIADINARTNGASEFRRFFNTPEVGYYSKSSTQFLPVLIGSGNLPQLKKPSSFADRFFMIKDPEVWEAGTYVSVDAYSTTSGGDLYDATDNLIQDGDDTEKSTATNANLAANGWFFDLAIASNQAQQAFGKAKLYASTVLFSTFSSEFTPDIDRCVLQGSKGVSHIYAVNLLDATSVYADFDSSDNDSVKDISDRSKGLGIPGLPPSPGLVFGDDKTRAIVGLEDVAEWPDRYHAIYWEEVLDEY